MISGLRAVASVVMAASLFSRPDPDVAEGNRLYQDGKYQEAVDAYGRARPRGPEERRRIAHNRGTALLRLGEYGEAREALREAQGDADQQLRSRAAFNEGNAAFMMKDLPGAALAFRRALMTDPGFAAARRNLELTLLAMEQPDAGQPDGGGGDGGGGDGGSPDGGSPDGGGGDGGGQGDGGGGGGDGGAPDGGGGDGGSPAQQKPQPQPQQREITEQDALRLLDSLRDAEQDQLLMRFSEEAASETPPEKTW